MINFTEYCESLALEIQKTYEEAVTMPEAEALAGKFLYAQIQVTNELRRVDLDSRMKKSGLKAVKAAVYMENATKSDKKPSDVMLGAMVDLDKMVIDEQLRFDESEVNKNALENYYSIFREAHVHYRTIAKGKFDG